MRVVFELGDKVKMVCETVGGLDGKGTRVSGESEDGSGSGLGFG